MDGRFSWRNVAVYTFSVATSAAAQTSPATIVLDKNATEFPIPAIASSMLVELRDGRVLAANARKREITVLDFVKGTATVVAREGDGPMDIRFPGYFMFGITDGAVYHSTPLAPPQMPLAAPNGVLPLPPPPPSRPPGRLLYFSDTGVPLRQEVYVTPMIPGVLPPTGIDLLGRFYTRGSGIPDVPSRDGCMRTADSVPVYRIDRTAKQTEVVTYVPRQALTTPMLRTTCGAPDSLGFKVISTMYASREFRANDVFAVLPDGRLAMLRNGDYRVRFVGGAAGETLGPPIPYTPVSVTDADRTAAMDSARAVRDRNGARSGTGRFAVEDQAPTPPNKSPYDGVQLAMDGRMFVSVPTPIGEVGKRYDVLDASGALIKRISLAPGESFAGAGRGTIYTVRDSTLKRYKY